MRKVRQQKHIQKTQLLELSDRKSLIVMINIVKNRLQLQNCTRALEFTKKE